MYMMELCAIKATGASGHKRAGAISICANYSAPNLNLATMKAIFNFKLVKWKHTKAELTFSSFSVSVSQ